MLWSEGGLPPLKLDVDFDVDVDIGKNTLNMRSFGAGLRLLSVNIYYARAFFKKRN
jgi:hypothetical protein